MDIVAQIGYSREEVWAARLYANAKPLRFEDIPKQPRSGWMPVGTVEFCRAAMAHQGIPEPDPLDYPEGLAAYPGGINSHRLGVFADLPEGWTPENHQGIHGKPYRTKLPQNEWRPDTPFWYGPWHRFGPEYRFYVLQGVILGYGRYDDKDDDPEDRLELDWTAVRGMVETYQRNGAPKGYALDVGVSDQDGRTYLIEINDGWALGLYKGTCSPRDYLRLLQARWEGIAGAKKPETLGL
jgi:hypothetical protein